MDKYETAKLTGLSHYVRRYVWNAGQRDKGCEPWYTTEEMNSMSYVLCCMFNWDSIAVYLDKGTIWNVACCVSDSEVEVEMFVFDEETEEIHKCYTE